jgi:hypothetical protein
VGAGGALGSGAGCPYLLASYRLRGSPDRAFSYLVLTRNMSRAFPRSSQTNRLCRQKLDSEPPSHVPNSTGLSHIPLRLNTDEPKRSTTESWGQRDACATLLLLRPRTYCGGRVVGRSCHTNRPRASAPTRAEPSTNVGCCFGNQEDNQESEQRDWGISARLVHLRRSFSVRHVSLCEHGTQPYDWPARAYLSSLDYARRPVQLKVERLRCEAYLKFVPRT